MNDEFVYEVWVSRSEFMDLDRRFSSQAAAEKGAADASVAEADTLHEVWHRDRKQPISQWENGKQVTV